MNACLAPAVEHAAWALPANATRATVAVNIARINLDLIRGKPFFSLHDKQPGRLGQAGG
jgi:hypothetical protein